MSRIDLFCFPYAGGSAVAYSKWKRELDPRIELRPIELAGRGRRSGEAFYKDLPEAVQDLYSLIKKDILQKPYALFGHSMGGLIAYELAQLIRSYGLPGPLHLFISGKGAPHIERKDEKKYHLMEMADFRKELINLGGTPPDFFENPEIVELFLPVLKNDFKLVETVPSSPAIRPLDGDITILLGEDDDLTPEQCEGWRRHTRQRCNFHYFKGGHFFLNDEMQQIVRIMNATLG